MKGKGSVTLLIGFRNTGKSTKVKQILAQSQKPRYIYDFRHEYGHELIDFDVFMDTAITLTGYNVVIEEATVFLGRRSDPKAVKNLLAGADHRSNNIFICYHSLRSVPDYILDQTNYYYLFHTTDTQEKIKSLFNGENDILEDFNAVRLNPGEHFYKFRRRL